ncbi:outer membrane protein TOM13-domain-containing protein [Neohortaea acidophila]|uniref:Outer membrane protein TOM13-domain-containing protein n=1 Tax=Neohortaea acidophila TaxID=245834 RepID=A0A6A6PV96_9PEZI|nr:outer membrane protein TOM13-domain-containing protein [Neohortaea acidophila]KAF2483641.1 outer membrane protein TOM13-domain-containing protein [Neohortaea acidophila]
MSSHDRLSESATFPSSDSENYDANHSNSQDSDEPISSSSPPLILYSPPTIWSILRGAAINLFLPFINGLMLGFGELVAHETAYRLGWSGTKIFPSGRSARTVGPGVEMQEDVVERKRRSGEEMDGYTALE